jgi:hypothetical protein
MYRAQFRIPNRFSTLEHNFFCTTLAPMAMNGESMQLNKDWELVLEVQKAQKGPKLSSQVTC